MAEKDNLEITIGGMPKVQRHSDFIAIYSNQSRMRLTPVDVQIMFGVIDDQTPDGSQPVNQERVAVVMSPQHAKVLLHAMTAAIQTYEKQYGEIKIPGVGTGAPKTPEEIKKILIEALRTRQPPPPSGK